MSTVLGVDAGAFELAMDDRVECRVARLGALDRGVHQLAGMDVAAPDEVGQRGGVEVVVLGDRHQYGTRPPLTTIVWPETKAESSDSR